MRDIDSLVSVDMRQEKYSEVFLGLMNSLSISLVPRKPSEIEER
jgi:hypothetical protein